MRVGARVGEVGGAKDEHSLSPRLLKKSLTFAILARRISSKGSYYQKKSIPITFIYLLIFGVF